MAIIIVIDNLKYVIIFIYIYILGFCHEKFQKSPKMYLSVQVTESLGGLIVQTFSYYRWIKNHLINFPMCTECKEEG